MTSYTEFNKYLNDVIKLELLSYNEETRSYLTSEKGYRYLSIYGRSREELN